MNCKNCGAPMRIMEDRDYFFCEYCGSYLFPKPSSDGVVMLQRASDLTCPICSTVLSLASVAGVRVLYCSKCRGVLTDQESFSTIVKFLRAEAEGPPDPARPLDPESLERRIQCPHCGRTMNTHPYYGPGNIVIDNCAPCALIWLDYGELSIIRDAPGRDRR